MRILAVDDDPVTRDLLDSAMRQSGFGAISFAASGEEALQAVADASEPFDTFLLDIMMPGIDGIALCERLRALPEYRSAPIIMITGDRQHDSMSRAFDAGATDYVSKPFDGLELGTRINMAALLTDSLRRERESQDRLDALTHLTTISFDDRFDLMATPGLKPFLTLENDLLRRGEALYAMTLFRVELTGAKDLFRAQSATAYRHGMQTTARAVSEAIDSDTTRFAHGGRGTFVAVVYSRERVDLEALSEMAQASLEAHWAGDAPAINVAQIGEQRLWSGLSAAEALRSFQGRADLTEPAEPVEVNGLFERLTSKLLTG
ncbi:response regulator [Sulfitobacter albidus]|uniref:Response regulator n=1 Tax=Sulfitobacter albidus TaxID=2829501 RepID=A0A975JDW7_9RHOB|nr:response regulator [Sulfitobacter albidus]QUJ76648.1 response regulator [Sulfitobacter albidus]